MCGPHSCPQSLAPDFPPPFEEALLVLLVRAWGNALMPETTQNNAEAQPGGESGFP